jgi:SAM-dependent methyltransferase
MTIRSRLEGVHNPDFESPMLETLASEIAALARESSGFPDGPCPACASSERELSHDLYGLSFQRCLQCRTVYLSPCPTEARIVEFLRTSLAMRHWAEAMPEATRRSRRRSVYAPRASFIEAEQGGRPGKTLIEIGGGGGELAAEIADRALFEKIIVIDPQPTAHVPSGVEFHRTAFTDFTFDGRADCVAAFEVLEHIVDPNSFLRKVRSLLAPGGHFIFTTPNIDGFETSVLGTRSQATWFDHVRLYNPESLRILLDRNGFEAVRLETPGELDVEIVHREYEKDPDHFAGDPDLRFLMTRGFAWRNRVQDFLKSRLMSSHMRCVARPLS